MFVVPQQPTVPTSSGPLCCAVKVHQAVPWNAPSPDGVGSPASSVEASMSTLSLYGSAPMERASTNASFGGGGTTSMLRPSTPPDVHGVRPSWT
jgi:hypothetical protein